MTRDILIIILFIISFNCIAQELPIVDGKVIKSEVIQMDSTKKNELYLRAKSFFINAFKSAKDVIQYDDKQEGIIIGKGLSQHTIKIKGLIPVYMGYTLNFTVKIQLKEGRYKYDIYDLSTKVDPSQYNLSPTATPIELTLEMKKIGKTQRYSGMYDQQIDAAKNELIALSNQIQKSMAIDSKNNDW